MQSGGPDEAWASGEGGEGSRTAVATLGGGLGGLAWGGRARERVRTAGQGSYCMSSEQQAAGRAGQGRRWTGISSSVGSVAAASKRAGRG